MVVHHTNDSLDAPQLSADSAARVRTIGLAIGAIGIVLLVVGMLADAKRFSWSYLVGFSWTATIGLGALFFVILQHLAKAGWSVTPRRHAEWISQILPVCLLLFIPLILIGGKDLWTWLPGGEMAAEEAVKKKGSWLSPGFFYGRAFFYMLVWTFQAWWFHRQSTKQDESGDAKLTLKMQTVSAPMVLLFGITLTFAAFDWLMSLDPRWYSTIFGVYVFAGSFEAGLAVMVLILLTLNRTGVLKRVANVEHRHDLGKLMFAFVVFWAYIGFSQFMLIWYANLPEETIFFARRWVGGWKNLSLLLLFGHFVIPFLFLLPRTTKRVMNTLTAAAIWMLFIHYIDMYWLVIPNGSLGTLSFSWLDIAGLLGPAGVLVAVICWKASKGPLYPIKDPRLAESMRDVNL